MTIRRSPSTARSTTLFLISLLTVPLVLALPSAASERRELVEKRGSHTRVFDNGDGTETLDVYSSSLHYQDADGRWQPIDTTISPYISQGEPGYAVTRNRFHVYFPKYSHQPLRFQMGDRWVRFQVKHADNVEVQVKGNIALYPNAWTAADLRYTVHPDGLKEEVVLRDKSAPPSYSFQIHLQGVRAEQEADGSIGFYDLKDGGKVWVLPPAFAFDSHMNQDGSAPAYTQVQMDLKTNGNNTFVELTLDPAWLSDPSRDFPVFIDPTVIVTAQGTGPVETDPIRGWPYLRPIPICITIPFAQTVRYEWYMGYSGRPTGLTQAPYVAVATTPWGREVFYREFDYRQYPPVNPQGGSGTHPATAFQSIYISAFKGNWWATDRGAYPRPNYPTVWISLTYNNNPPPTVELLELPRGSVSPFKGDYVSTGLPTFKWVYHDSGQDYDHQQQYEIQISLSEDFTGVNNRRQIGDLIPPTPANTDVSVPWNQEPLADGQWYWRVRGFDGEHWSAWSPAQSFRIDDTPPAFPVVKKAESQYVPAPDGSSQGGLSITWGKSTDNASGVAAYELQWNRGAGWQQAAGLVSHMDSQVEYFRSMAGLALNELVKLRIRAIDKAGNMENPRDDKDWYYFEAATPAQSPSIASYAAAGNASTGYSVSVNLNLGAASAYRIRRSTMPPMADPSRRVWQESSPFTGPACVDQGLEKHQTYYYQVDASNVQGKWTGFTSEVKVTVPNNPPSAPLPVLPEADAVLNQKEVELSCETPVDPDGDSLSFKFEVVKLLDGNQQADFSQPDFSSGWVSSPRFQTVSLPDGVYYWRVLVRDEFVGEDQATVLSSSEHKFAVDTKGLGASFRIKEGEATSSLAIALSGITIIQGSEGGEAAGLRVRNELPGLGPDEGWSEVYPIGTASIPWVLPPGDGVKKVSLQVLDQAGNWGRSYQQAIILDTIKPLPPVWQVTIGLPQQEVLARWYPASDGSTGSGIAGYEVEYDRTDDTVAWVSLGTTLPGFEVAVKGLDFNEKVLFRIRAKDKVGLVSDWSTVTGYALPQAGSIADAQSGYNQGHYVELKLESVAAANYKIEVVEDNFGGASGSGWLLATDHEGSARVAAPTYRDEGLVPHSSYYYRVITRSPLGQEVRGPVKLVTVGNNPPPQPGNLVPRDNDWINRDTVQLTHDLVQDVDAGDTVKYKYTLWDDTGRYLVQGAESSQVSGLEHGRTYSWFVVAEDNYGAKVPSETAQFRVDLVPPSVTLSNTSTEWAAAQGITIEGSDSLTGNLRGLDYRWGEGEWTQVSSGATITAPPGANSLTVRATDVAGNETIITHVYRVDVTPPSVRGLYLQARPLLTAQPEAEVTVVATGRDGLSTTWEIADSESGVAGYRYCLVREGETADFTQVRWLDVIHKDGRYQAFIAGQLADGEVWRAAIQARDKVGQTTEPVLSHPVLIDGSTPVLDVRVAGGVREVGGNLYTANLGSIQLEVVKADPHSGIAQVDYVLTTSPALSGNEQWLADPAGLAASVTPVDGATYYVAVRAMNGAGLVTVVFTPAIRLDQTPPVITSLSDAGDRQRENTSLSATVGAEDAESGLAALRYAVVSRQADGTETILDLVGSESGWVTVPQPLPRMDLVVRNLNLTDGTHFIKVVAVNGAGLETAKSTDGIVVDSTLPAAPRITDDGVFTPLTKSFHAWWILDDQRAVDHYLYRLVTYAGTTFLDWRPAGAGPVNQPVEITILGDNPDDGLNLAQGETYLLEVQAVFADGTTSPVGRSNGITVDSTPPTGLTVEDGVYALPDRLQFSWQGQDDTSGIAGYYYAVGTTRGGTETTDSFVWAGQATSVLCTKLLLQSGQVYYVTVLAANGAGLESAVTSDGVMVDGTPPPTPSVLDGGTYATNLTQLSASWTWTPPDPESGTVAYAYALLTQPYAAVDTTWVAAGTATKVNVSGLALAEGATYYFAVKATNGAGLSSVGYSDGITVDSTAPPVPLIDDGGDYTNSNSSLTAAFSSVDLQSGIQGYRYSAGTLDNPGALADKVWLEGLSTAHSVTVNGTLEQGGIYFFTAVAVNNAGLVSNTGRSDGIMVDTDYPRITEVKDDGSYTRSNSELAAAWSASTSGSPIVEYEYAVVDNSNATPATWLSSGVSPYAVAKGLALVDGKTYYVLVRARNAAGTWTPPSDWGKSDGIIVDASPPPAPVVTIEGRYSAGAIYFWWEGDDPDSHIGSWRYAVGTTRGVTDVTGGWREVAGDARQQTVTGLPLVDGGVYYVTVVTKNRAGAWSVPGYSNAIIADLTPPTTPQVTVEGGYTQFRTAIKNLRWSSQDPQAGIAAWRWAVTPEKSGTIAFGPEGPTEATSLLWDATSLDLAEAGTYWVAVRTRNSAGLWSEVGFSPPIIVDSLSPQVTFPQAGEELVTNDGRLEIPWTCSEPVRATFTITCEETGYVEQRPTELVSQPGAHSLQVQVSETAIYRVALETQDLAGNAGARVEQVFRYNAAPEVFAGFDRTVRKMEPVTFEGWASDSDGTVVAYHWDFGDGTPGSDSATVEHRYAALGDYAVTLTATDNDGRSASSRMVVKVTNTSSGELYSDETWSGEYSITGRVVVPVGITLTIQPGTKVTAARGAEVVVLGRIVAAGTAAGPITFEAATQWDSWKGIRLDRTTQDNLLQYLVVKGAERGVAVILAKARLLQVTYEGNLVGLHVYGASPLVEGCRFLENTLYGIKEDAGGNPTVIDCTFAGNGAGAYYDEVETVIGPQRLNELGSNHGNQ